MSVNNEDQDTIEIIKDRLYWTASEPHPSPSVIAINTDREFRYLPFCNEIGPVDIGLTFKFCKKLESILSDPLNANKKIVHFTSYLAAKKANSAFLMGSFCIIILKMPASQTADLFSLVSIRFRDASEGPCEVFLSLSDCFQAIEQATRRNWFDFSSFSLKDYDFFSRPSNGDLNWVIPNQFLAFSTPGAQKMPPEKYAEIFNCLKIKTVVRLNKPKYSSAAFTDKGIKHFDLHFKDGSVPDISLVNEFIDICSSQQGAVAVHCKAGLGRTGTLIGCYAIKIFKFPALAFIAWCRLCRPGSVLGQQQQFLIDYEWSVKNKTKLERPLVLGDQNQGKRLLNAKNRKYGTESFAENEELSKSKAKIRRLDYELSKLCKKKYSDSKSAWFYESVSKSLKADRVFKILYGSNDD